MIAIGRHPIFARLYPRISPEGRMHQLMGARFAGCATPSDAEGSYGPMMGAGGMMGGY